MSKIAKVRVSQLAKELGVQSKDIIARCTTEGLDEVKQPQSTVSVGLAETIREWFAGAASAAVAVAEAPAKAAEAIATEAGRGVAELQSRLSEFLGPQEAARAASEAFRESGADFLCADTYQFFGVLSFYAPETEPSLWLPETGRKRFPWVDERAWNGKKALVAEWPRSGCNYAWLFARTVWTKKVALPGLTRPLTLTLVEGYDMKRVREK